MMVTNRSKTRAQTRRTISEAEIRHLEELGSELRRLREEAHMTIVLLAERSEISERQLRHILDATRRTRSSTLFRIATSLALATEHDPRQIHRRLVELAGPALAPEPLPEHREHVDRRRARRTRKKARENERKRQDKLVKSIQSELREKEARRQRRQAKARQAPTDEQLVVPVEESRRKDRERKQEAKDKLRPPLIVRPYVPQKRVRYVKSKS